MSFVLATAAMAAESYFLGYYALFFVLLSWIGGHPQSNLGMVLKGIGPGITTGYMIGLTGRLLSGTL